MEEARKTGTLHRVQFCLQLRTIRFQLQISSTNMKKLEMQKIVKVVGCDFNFGRKGKGPSGRGWGLSGWTYAIRSSRTTRNLIRMVIKSVVMVDMGEHPYKFLLSCFRICVNFFKMRENREKQRHNWEAIGVFVILIDDSGLIILFPPWRRYTTCVSNYVNPVVVVSCLFSYWFSSCDTSTPCAFHI